MNSDRELLELAAKANWRQELADEEVTLRFSESDEGMLYLHADNQDHNGTDREFLWNPLTQDHDALRLAVKLRFGMTLFAPRDMPDSVGMVEIWQEDENDPTYVEWYKAGADRYDATRRAIVRAAAKIGKALP